jgi:hypothetical protein
MEINTTKNIGQFTFVANDKPSIVASAFLFEILITPEMDKIKDG